MNIIYPALVALAVTMAILAIVGAPPAGSRRRLVIALSVAVPFAGPLLAIMLCRVKGRGARVERGDSGDELLDGIDVEQVRRLAELPSLLELLLSEVSSDRQAALVVLAARADAGAVRMLRWAIDHGEPATVLEAALTLSELDYQFEHELEVSEERLAEQPTPHNALVTAKVLARAIHSGLTDSAIMAGMGARARCLFRLAVADPQADEVAEAELSAARLELAMGNPGGAIEWLQRHVGSPTPVTRALYERARFGARLPAGLAAVGGHE